jgi:secreted PhoX family phosphatase
MGRFVHEAIAVDPATGIVYETEDRDRAGLYRFIPDRPYTPGRGGDLGGGGRLQMLAIRERPNYDTSRGQRADVSLPVEWVDIGEPDPPAAPTDPAAVFAQGERLGGARFRRLEGCWYGAGDRAVYVNCTSGGAAGMGQVWRYRPADETLTLVFESPGPEVLDSPDNVCVSPRGGIVVCEDGDGTQYVRGLTPQGHIFDFARNLGDESEFAGATFSPDGRTLFVNIQGNAGRGVLGRTFAVWGPWERGAL